MVSTEAYHLGHMLLVVLVIIDPLICKDGRPLILPDHQYSLASDENTKRVRHLAWEYDVPASTLSNNVKRTVLQSV